MEINKIRIGKEIWPGETEERLNSYLGKLNIQAKFLLFDGIEFRYPSEDLETYNTGSGVYFRDTRTKEPILHVFEDFGTFEFESSVIGNFSLQILEEEISDL